jgi:hypothetical protein
MAKLFTLFAFVPLAAGQNGPQWIPNLCGSFGSMDTCRSTGNGRSVLETIDLDGITDGS